MNDIERKITLEQRLKPDHFKLVWLSPALLNVDYRTTAVTTVSTAAAAAAATAATAAAAASQLGFSSSFQNIIWI